MNTATDLIGMDNETIAHRLISMGKGKGVMQALLAHAGLGYTAASYIAADIPGAVSGTVLLIDYRPGDVRVHIQLHNPRDCEQFAPGYNVQLHPVGDRGAVAKGEMSVNEARIRERIREQIRDWDLPGVTPNTLRLGPEEYKALNPQAGNYAVIAGTQHLQGEVSLKIERVEAAVCQVLYVQPSLREELEEREARRVSSSVLKRYWREVEHCDECGGPDVYHAAFCSKAGDVP